MSLKNLIALQSKKPAAPIESTAQGSAPPLAAPPVAESLPVPPKPKGLGLNVAGTKAFTPSTTPAPTKAPASARPKPAPKPVESGEFSLDDLAALEAGSIEAAPSVNLYEGFDDEIEATAPDRELPADITTEQLSFVESLDSIYQVLHDPEMFGQTVRLIMIELQENNEYERLLSDSDVATMIRGMRRTMGLARVRKQEKSRKTGTQKNARKTSGVSDNAMELLNSLMGSGDD